MKPKTPILDACCGSKMMWFDKQNADVTYCDNRTETLTVTDRSHGNHSGTRTLEISPDIECDFRDMPFDSGSFKLVVFDPPHLIRAGKKSWLAAKYGKLNDSWQGDLKDGFREAFRVLEPSGILIFKWNETQIKVSEIIKLAPQPPLFGHKSGKLNKTHWLTFMKNTSGH